MRIRAIINWAVTYTDQKYKYNKIKLYMKVNNLYYHKNELIRTGCTLNKCITYQYKMDEYWD